MYEMLDSEGNVLIGETCLNPTSGLSPSDAHVRRPRIAIDSENNLHIVFFGKFVAEDFGPAGYGSARALSAPEVMYLKINPYADDRDGSPSDAYTLTVIPETIISTEDSTKSRPVDIAVDPFDRVHVVWFDEVNYGFDLRYLVMDKNGNVLVPETTVVEDTDADPYGNGPWIATDSEGNAHIVFSSSTGSEAREVHYTMVDGSTGETFINDTRITADDGHDSVRPALAVDSNGRVHVVWHDRRYYDEGIGEHEIFYTVVDPDPQTGTLNIVVPEQPITANDGYKSHMPDIAVDPGNRAHVIWRDQRDTPKGEIYYTMIGHISETRVTHFDGSIHPLYNWRTDARKPELAATNDKVYITFQGYNTTEGTCDIYLEILSVPPPAPVVGGELEVTPAKTESPLNIAAEIMLLIAPASVATASAVIVIKTSKKK
jgi:hypothetical protein